MLAVVLGKWVSGRLSRETIPTIIDISIFYHLDLHHKVHCNWIKIGRHCIVDGLCQKNLAGLWQEKALLTILEIKCKLFQNQCWGGFGKRQGS